MSTEVYQKKILKGREEVTTEKYRPTSLRECVGQEHLMPDFENFIKNKDLPPAMIFTGDAGLGKTTIALILAYIIAGKGNTLYLDASQDNGIDIMRGRVKDHMVTHGRISQNLKIIIFDEADNISFPAQQALRRSIEVHSRHVRIIFICNYLRRIIEPIQSRCGGSIYRFRKISKQSVLKRLEYIAKKDNIKISIDNLRKIAETSNGDIRKAILTLDGIKKGASISNLIRTNYDMTFIQYCLTGNYINLRTYINNNISDSQELKQILKNSLNLIIDSKHQKFTNELYGKQLKSKIIELIGECENNLARNANYYISSLWLASRIYLTINKYTNNGDQNK